MCSHLLQQYWNDASCIMFVNSARLELHAPFRRIMSVVWCGHHSINQLPLFSLDFSLTFLSGKADPASSFICGSGKRYTLLPSHHIYHHLACLAKVAADVVMDREWLDQFCCGFCKCCSSSLGKETQCYFLWLCHTTELWSLASSLSV